MIRTVVLVCSVAAMSTSCAALEKAWVKGHCNYNGAYSDGINDQKAGRKMYAGQYNTCPGKSREVAGKAYRKGYLKGMANASSQRKAQSLQNAIAQAEANKRSKDRAEADRIRMIEMEETRAAQLEAARLNRLEEERVARQEARRKYRHKHYSNANSHIHSAPKKDSNGKLKYRSLNDAIRGAQAQADRKQLDTYTHYCQGNAYGDYFYSIANTKRAARKKVYRQCSARYNKKHCKSISCNSYVHKTVTSRLDHIHTPRAATTRVTKPLVRYSHSCSTSAANSDYKAYGKSKRDAKRKVLKVCSRTHKKKYCKNINCRAL